MGDEVLARRLEATAATVAAVGRGSASVRAQANTILAEEIRWMGGEVRPPGVASGALRSGGE